MNTIGLSANWDLTLTQLGNIALFTDQDAIAQDVSSAIKLFLGELWYDTSKGVPHYEQILGRPYSESIVEGLLTTAALSVPDVVEARTTIVSVINRRITGTVHVIDKAGKARDLTF